MISLVVARARNGAIGRENTIPWHAPEDLKFFQRETSGGVIIMGRNTWDSLPFKPLKNRVNLVVSSKGVPEAEFVYPSLEAAIAAAHAMGHRRIYGIGGAGIYRELLPKADRLLITEVDMDVPDADTFFPEIEVADWHEVGRHTLRDEGPRCELVELLRRV
ncbi:dihydrofolate reductase [Marivivens sp. LCG002]|uniref:dihydrofolate reductase n=1 Tax=Marivivens sp. LCG002 TaxID=3051171 RepID=UPI0025569125|nr:dihydrofolate reductase [Marivivens sp. LCG002]WIV49955.1 dihydrofolate reductase [Marivivens sp. LCG002]